MESERERLDRVEGILRANRMHESHCAYRNGYVSRLRSPDPGLPVLASCDCWLAEPSHD